MLMQKRVLTGRRYIASLKDAGPERAGELMAEMDAFLLRTGAREVHVVSGHELNPFLPGVMEQVSRGSFSSGIAVHRQDLTSITVDALPGDGLAHPSMDEPAAKSYRARSLESFFSDTFTERSFVGPVFGALGAHISIDLASLVVAKASGFMIKHSGAGSFVRPWGGHCTAYAEASRLGILEGIERVGAEAPAGEQISAIPQGMRSIGPDGFGLAGEDWLTPFPEVRSWSVGTSLATGENVALPTRLVYYSPSTDESHWVQESSNGCAIGGSDEEAQMFGLLEAIERDAFLASWYGGLALDEICAESVENSLSRAYIDRLALCGQHVRFFDATVGVEIPTVIAVCTEPNGPSCVGAGSHPDPERALQSALVEVAADFQVVAQHLRERGPELASMMEDYSRVRVMADHADMFAHPGARRLLSLWLDSNHGQVTLGSLTRSRRGTSIGHDFADTLDACTRAGFEPIAVRTQSPLADAVGAHCWKVVVPGLIPIDFGFAYQRALKMPRLAKIARQFAGGGCQASEFAAHLVPHPFP